MKKFGQKIILKSVLRLHLTSDLVGGGVQQDRGHGVHGEGGHHSTLQCDSPVRVYNYGCNTMHTSNPRPKDIGLLQIESLRLLQWDCLVDAHLRSDQAIKT